MNEENREQEFRIDRANYAAAFNAVTRALIKQHPPIKVVTQSIQADDPKVALQLVLCAIDLRPYFFGDQITQLYMTKDDVYSWLNVVALRALAPFVLRGSYIRYGKNLAYRYYFDGAKVVMQNGTMTWPETFEFGED